VAALILVTVMCAALWIFGVIDGSSRWSHGWPKGDVAWALLEMEIVAVLGVPVFGWVLVLVDLIR
jgi:hypothetical protein